TYATAPQEAVYGVQMAIKHASLPRMGPAAVVMKTPMIRAEAPADMKPVLYPSAGYHRYTPPRPDPEAVRKLAEMFTRAKRPVIIAGNGVTMTESGQTLQELALANGIAVATSYNGKGVIAETAPVAVGMMGTWGHACANRAVAAADLIVMLGASMGPDYTRFRDPAMIRPGEQALVQVDIDPRNAGWVYPVDHAVTGDVADVLAELAKLDLGASNKAARLAHIASLREKWNFDRLPASKAAQGSVHHADI